MRGPPGTGKTFLGLSFLNMSMKDGGTGLFINFSHVPMQSFLRDHRSSANLSHLFQSEDPFLMDGGDIDRLGLLIGLMESGEVGRLVLDHPEIMEVEGPGDWFEPLSSVLGSARVCRVPVLVIGYPSIGSMFSYLSEGLLTTGRTTEGALTVTVEKWDWDRSNIGRRITEPEVGDWER